MQTAFDRALAFVLRFEGGASRDPADTAAAQVAAGEIHTNYGITQETYDIHRYAEGEPRQPVALIQMDEVGEVYLRRYWQRYALDEVAVYAPLLAMCLFDGAVQHGKNVQLWQRTVQAEPDGTVGPETLRKTEHRVKLVGEPLVMAAYLDRRAGYYQQIITLNPAQKKFRNGWRRRVNELCREVGVDPVWPV